MSGFSLDAQLQLSGTGAYRVSGWRGVCSFDGVVAPDGSDLFGCELTLKGADRLEKGQEMLATLRFWVPRNYAPDLIPGLALHLFEGDQEIASGVVIKVNENRS